MDYMSNILSPPSPHEVLFCHIRPPAAPQAETTAGQRGCLTDGDAKDPLELMSVYFSLSLSLRLLVWLLIGHDPEHLWPGLGWVLRCRTLFPCGPTGKLTSIWSPAPHSVGRGPVCFRNSHCHWKCNSRHHHLGHSFSSCPCFPAAG